MGSLLTYSGLTTKIRAMQSRLLTEENYREISELRSVGDFMAYLKQQEGYRATFADMDPATIHRGDIEVAMRFDIFRDFTRIYNFANVKQRHYLDLYFMRYEVRVLKRYLRNVFDSRGADTTRTVHVNDFELHSKIQTELVAHSATIEEMIANLKGTQYYEPLLKVQRMDQPSLFDYEICLDLYHYETVWKALKKFFKKSELDIMTHSYGVRIDLLNIAWIYRSKKYFTIDDKAIYSLLVPVHYKLRKNELKQMVEAEDMNAFYTVLSQTHYGRYLLDTDKQMSLEQLESRVLEQVHMKDYKQDPYSLATVNTYLYLKEKEYAKIITAAECIRYGLAPSEILLQLAK